MAYLFLLTIFGATFSNEEVNSIVNNIDCATSALKSYDLQITLHTETFRDKAGKNSVVIENLLYIHDWFKEEQGRRIEQSRGPEQENVSSFNQRHLGAISEDIKYRDPDGNVINMSLGFRLGSGRDYLSYIRPMINNKGLIERLRELQALGSLELTKEGSLLLLRMPLNKVPISTNNTIAGYGFEVWVDPLHGYMPVKFETFANVNGKKQPVILTQSELEEVKDGFWMPVRGKVSSFANLSKDFGVLKSITSMKVNVEKSKWNSETLDTEFLTNLPNRDDSVTIDAHKTSHDGWERWTEEPTDQFASKMSSSRFYLIAFNILIIVLLCLFILIRHNFRGLGQSRNYE